MNEHVPSIAGLLLAGLVTVVGAGCGGGGGGGSPSAPPTPPNLTGSYSGNVVYSGSSPGAHCFSKGLVRVGGHAFQVQATVTQQGSTLRGTLTGTQIEIVCEFSGTVQSNGSFTWSQTTCSVPCDEFDWSSEAAESCRLRVCAVAQNFSGNGRANGPLTGSLTVTWDTSISTNGSALGQVQLTGTFNLS